jgi:glycosyltransferase involved in cell wall biosynthesis
MAMRLRRTKSRSSEMPLYSVDARSRFLKSTFDRTPTVSIITDATDITSIPREIREIAGEEPRIVPDFTQWSKSKGRSDAALVWLVDERLLEGTERGLVKSLHAPNRRTFFVVNTPCVDDVPFLSIQPRVFTNSASVDHWNFRIRIESSSATAARAIVDSSRVPEPWARLVEAISAEKKIAGSGVEPLLRLWESHDKLSEMIAALVVRNLVAAMLLHREVGNARKFLEAGVKLYPTYAELYYLAALVAIREGRFGDALAPLEHAKSFGVVFPGSGGENSYRCDWLLGCLAAQVGNERVAFQHFIAGVKHDPPFEPSLIELLKLHLPRSVIESHQYDFTRAARRKPQMALRIFEYLLVHRSFDAARRLARVSPLGDVVRDDFENRLEMAVAGNRPSAQSSATKAGCSSSSGAVRGVVFEGPFLEYSSLARINREAACAVQASSAFELSIEPSSPSGQLARFLASGDLIAECFYKRLRRVDLTIRHQWPPNFRRPRTGKLAVILPWEYGGVPRAWIEQIRQNVDELWVPSNFVRDAFVRNGVDSGRVVVIPNGYDPEIFNPHGRFLRPQGSRDFIFLFVGGAIPRKGIDLLLEAFKSAFVSTANVTLALLVSGASGAYQHNSWVSQIQAAATDRTLPPVLPIFETVVDSTLANLYRGAGALVLPYRGEGFGLPLLEAMACGKPVITTADGPAKDFCAASSSYLIPATTVPVTDQPPPLGPMAGEFTWFEPDFAELVRVLRHVYENRSEAAAKGKRAAASIRHLTWEYVNSQYAGHVRKLCDLP